jgi:hypothetical protein
MASAAGGASQRLKPDQRTFCRGKKIRPSAHRCVELWLLPPQGFPPSENLDWIFPPRDGAVIDEGQKHDRDAPVSTGDSRNVHDAFAE